MKAALSVWASPLAAAEGALLVVVVFCVVGAVVVVPEEAGEAEPLVLVLRAAVRAFTFVELAGVIALTELSIVDGGALAPLPPEAVPPPLPPPAPARSGAVVPVGGVVDAGGNGSRLIARGSTSKLW